MHSFLAALEVYLLACQSGSQLVRRNTFVKKFKNKIRYFTILIVTVDKAVTVVTLVTVMTVVTVVTKICIFPKKNCKKKF